MSKILLILGAVALIFAWWGIKTEAGRRQFDEMAGIIPFAALLLGGLLVLAGLILFLVRR